jgi:signal transduction histidine kinase
MGRMDRDRRRGTKPGARCVVKARPGRPRALTGGGLTGQREFERFFSQLSSVFARIPDAEIDAAIASWLRRLVKALDVDRAGVSRVVGDGQIVLTHFCSIHCSLPAPRCRLHGHYPWFADQVRRAKIVRFERVLDELPTEAAAELDYVKKLGLKSHLMLPLNMAGGSLGALAFGTIRRYRRWPDALVRRLQLVAQVFGNALAHKEARLRLQERLAFERLITSLVATFVNVAASRVDAHLHQGLYRLVEHLHVDEISFGQVPEEGALAVTCRVRSHRPSRESAMATVPWHVDALRRRLAVVANSPQEMVFVDLDRADAEQTTGLRHGSDNLSRTSSPSKPLHRVVDLGRDVELHGFQPHVSIPLMADDRLWGIITAVTFHRSRAWTVWEIQQLRVVGEIMMEAVLRRDMDEKTGRQRNELVHVARAAALGELTAALAHELNQPLAAIRMNAQTVRRLLASDRDSDEMNEIFDDIAADATRAAGLIVSLRNLLRRHELEKADLDMNQVIEDARFMADAEASRHGARLVLTFASGLPNIRGDAMQLQQVVLNLVRNAAQAMADMTPDPEVVVQTWATPPGHVTVSVEDTGPPIDAATFESMFVAFQTTKSDGLGIGLAISQSIIEAHGGRLWAERRPEAGLVVRFSLPASARVG